jgi:hypothetical protein
MADSPSTNAASTGAARTSTASSRAIEVLRNSDNTAPYSLVIVRNQNSHGFSMMRTHDLLVHV